MWLFTGDSHSFEVRDHTWHHASKRVKITIGLKDRGLNLDLWIEEDLQEEQNQALVHEERHHILSKSDHISHDANHSLLQLNARIRLAPLLKHVNQKSLQGSVLTSKQVLAMTIFFSIDKPHVPHLISEWIQITQLCTQSLLDNMLHDSEHTDCDLL